MRSITDWRSRPTAENLLLLAVAVCLAIAAVRAVFVLVAVPTAVYADSQAVAAAQAAGSTAPTQTVLTRIGESAAWQSWWGGRVVPFRDGGDYIGVMWHSQPTRTVGAVIGVLIERDRAKGVKIDRVVVPMDEEALFGQPPGALFTRPDGTTFRSQWAHIDRYARSFTDVPVERRAYAPFLDSAKAAALAAKTHLTLRAHDFFMADPVPGSSGTWVLYSRQGASREYLLVPQELMTAGGAS